MADFKKLLVWQKAHAMSLEVDEVASTIRGVQYSQLRTQLTRSSASIPTNIVEGRAQATEREFARFLRYAIASAAETEYHLITARDKGVISDRAFESLTDQVIEVRKMLYGLVDKLTTGAANDERPEKRPEEENDGEPKPLTA